MSRAYLIEDSSTLARVQREYRDLAEAGAARYALRSAFDHDGFSIVEYCRGFSPNPAAAEAEDAVRAWARRSRMWIPGITEHCIDMAAYMYPRAAAGRLVTIGKSLAISWYLNDTIGRERISGLTADQKLAADRSRDRLVRVSRTLTVGSSANPIERACREMLWEMRSGAPPEWFEQFRDLWATHLESMCRDGNAAATNAVPTTTQYVDARTHCSGMQHTIALFEFARNEYLDWTELDRLAPIVRQLCWLCAVIGCLSNDLFSFEKEFVRHGSDSNLILVSILNDPDLTLPDAITATIARVRDHVIEFRRHLRHLAARCAELPRPAPLRAFLESARACLMASWVWQLLSLRYKSPGSIFEECRSG
jgi:Terpene synthase family 2, C-terminal metal binding